ncbi:MAG: hypothetical protein Kow00120_06390 [Anaerolineae bacterium]
MQARRLGQRQAKAELAIQVDIHALFVPSLHNQCCDSPGHHVVYHLQNANSRG